MLLFRKKVSWVCTMIFSSRCRHWFVICANLFRCNNHTESLLDPYTPPEMHPFGSVFESFPPVCLPFVCPYVCVLWLPHFFVGTERGSLGESVHQRIYMFFSFLWPPALLPPSMAFPGECEAVCGKQRCWHVLRPHVDVVVRPAGPAW